MFYFFLEETFTNYYMDLVGKSQTDDGDPLKGKPPAVTHSDEFFLCVTAFQMSFISDRRGAFLNRQLM